MARPLRIGLTGGIASGKTTVAARFAELGVPVIDADEVSRVVVEPGQPALAQITARFGAEMLTEDGRLNRLALRNVVFAEPLQRKALEAILHPLIRAEMERRAVMARAPYLVMAIPLLLETGKLDRIDRILVVDVDEASQLQRVMARDASTLAQARAVIDAQTSREVRLRAADDVIVNSGTISELRRAADELHQRYLQLAAPPDSITTLT
jgi:dephospho-CoA kinase